MRWPTLAMLLAACRGDLCDLPTDFVGGESEDWVFDVPDVEGVERWDVLLSEDALDDLRALDTELQAWVAAGAIEEEEPERQGVCGAVHVEGHGTIGGVTVKLKGEPGNSYSPIDEQPYFQLDFPEDAHVGDLASLKLYNGKQDVSGLQAYLAYRAWREGPDGEPRRPAPRSGYAVVALNGETLGVYEPTEPIDASFLDRWAGFGHFGPGGSLYEGEYGADLTTAAYASMEVKQVETDREEIDELAELGAVAAALEAADSLEDLAAAGVHTDSYLDFWAMEIVVGAREGYTVEQNNFYVYEDPSAEGAERFHFLPWGFDQTLYDELPADGYKARLPDIGVTWFRDAWHERLAEVADATDWEGLQAEADRIVGILDALDVPSQVHAPEDVEAQRALVLAYLRDREAQLLEEVGAR